MLAILYLIANAAYQKVKAQETMLITAGMFFVASLVRKLYMVSKTRKLSGTYGACKLTKYHGTWMATAATHVSIQTVTLVLTILCHGKP